jgi:hypothetical protein
VPDPNSTNARDGAPCHASSPVAFPESSPRAIPCCPSRKPRRANAGPHSPERTASRTDQWGTCWRRRVSAGQCVLRAPLTAPHLTPSPAPAAVAETTNRRTADPSPRVVVQRRRRERQLNGHRVQPLARRPYVDCPQKVAFGLMDKVCGKCHAQMWVPEHVKGSTSTPSFGQCCSHGKVALDLLPDLLTGTGDECQQFRAQSTRGATARRHRHLHDLCREVSLYRATKCKDIAHSRHDACAEQQQDVASTCAICVGVEKCGSPGTRTGKVCEGLPIPVVTWACNPRVMGNGRCRYGYGSAWGYPRVTHATP